MIDIARRRLLQGAAASAAMTALGPFGAAAAPAKLTDIDHVFILMKENRSFDHYFGTLRGVRGFDDAAAAKLPDGSPIFAQPDPASPAGHVLPFRMDGKTTRAQHLLDLS